MFDQTALTGNIWMLDPAGQDNWNQPGRGNAR
jgi:hypothetical protein